MVKRLFSGLVPFLCCLPVLSADVLYSNITAGFHPGSGTGTYSFSGPNAFLGTTFTTTGAGSLATISIGIEGDQSPITAGLYANAAGEPGTLIESWTFAQPPFGANILTTITSVLHPSLSAGTPYWFVLDLSGSEDWTMNDEAVTGGVWFGSSSVSTLSQAFGSSSAPGIQLNSVPEPTAGLMFALGSLLLLARMKGFEGKN